MGDIVTREKFLQEYRALTEENKRTAEVNKRVVSRLKSMLLHANKQTDELMGAIYHLNELSKGFAFLLNRTSRAITEKAIWDEIEKYEAKMERSKFFYPGYPGVPKKVVEQGGKKWKR